MILLSFFSFWKSYSPSKMVAKYNIKQNKTVEILTKIETSDDLDAHSATEKKTFFVFNFTFQLSLLSIRHTTI